ncbi:MAG TPA: PLP-dependent aminotransferase family protein, partial [Stellaceae bacterium]|nr:PLP-dependent aminotransferase family protein [Stellaceae bacterium]
LPEHPLPPVARLRRLGAKPPRLGRDRALALPPRPFDHLPLAAGLPALDRFPWSDWARITARLLRERPQALIGYCDPRGERPLRQAIAQYLAANRGIACDPDQILVVAGSQQGIDLTARALAEPGDSVWVEEPGYPAGRAALRSAGFELAPVPVDEEGIDVGAGVRQAPRARLALVAPSHQYPLGAVMSLRRRLALLDWAESADAWILEDDYDGDYRYGGRPLAPLYTLDRGNRVLFLGTFSKVLAPGLRLGYLVVPPAAVERFAELKAASDRHAPGLLQIALARFIEEGRLAAHLRRMRTLYASRRATLLEALAAEADGLLEAHATPEAGLHLVAHLRRRIDDVAASARALKARVHAAPLSSYYSGTKPERGFVLGFAGTPEEQMRGAVRRLVAAAEAN